MAINWAPRGDTRTRHSSSTTQSTTWISRCCSEPCSPQARRLSPSPIPSAATWSPALAKRPVIQLSGIAAANCSRPPRDRGFSRRNLASIPRASIWPTSRDCPRAPLARPTRTFWRQMWVSFADMLYIISLYSHNNNHLSHVLESITGRQITGTVCRRPRAGVRDAEISRGTRHIPCDAPDADDDARRSSRQVGRGSAVEIAHVCRWSDIRSSEAQVQVSMNSELKIHVLYYFISVDCLIDCKRIHVKYMNDIFTNYYMWNYRQRKLYLNYHLPWAVQTGKTAKFLLGVYFEERWEQPLEDFHKEMNIKRLV